MEIREAVPFYLGIGCAGLWMGICVLLSRAVFAILTPEPHRQTGRSVALGLVLTCFPLVAFGIHTNREKWVLVFLATVVPIVLGFLAFWRVPEAAPWVWGKWISGWLVTLVIGFVTGSAALILWFAGSWFLLSELLGP